MKGPEGETLSALENKPNYVQVTFAFDDNLCNSKKVNNNYNNNSQNKTSISVLKMPEGETLSALENKRNVQVTFAFDDNLCNFKKVNHISNNDN